ncbi:MAG: methionyl-tRNA formyltransferase [bacterium]|nr:methionyl-tRNA formyltransferase [bacterium]
MKIVFFGTSDVGLPILEALHHEHTILKVITSPDAPVGRKQVITPSPIADKASMLGLSVEKPLKVKNNPEFIESLTALRADIFIVVSYGKILPEELLNIPSLKTINIHFSLLPKYRGASPIQFALTNDEIVTGTTIFILDALVDHGPILAQQELSIAPDDTLTTLAPKLSELSKNLLLDILPKYESGEIIPYEQNHDEATHVSLIEKEDGKIDWNNSAQSIYNQFPGFIVWPGIWTTWEEKKLKILGCQPVLVQEPGTLTIPCGDNSLLQITILQPEGKNPMTAKDFLNGYPRFDFTHLK